MDKNSKHSPIYILSKDTLLSVVKFIFKDQLNIFILASILLCLFVINKLFSFLTLDLTTYQSGNLFICLIIAFINILAFILSFIFLSNTYSIFMSYISDRIKYIIMIISSFSAITNFLIFKISFTNFIQKLDNISNIKVNIMFVIKGFFTNQYVINYSYSNIFFWVFWISLLILFATLLSFKIPTKKNIE